MYSQTYYLLRSKQDGRHLSARDTTETSDKLFLLVFIADYEALVYLSTHAPDMRDRFTVESISVHQLKMLLTRWGFTGIGIVRDPTASVVEFLKGDGQP